MEPFKSILVRIDAGASIHPALERAVLIARNSGAKLTIADVMPTARGQLLQASIEGELASHRRERLARIAGGVTGVPTRPVLLTGRPTTALIREVLLSGHDLLLHSHLPDLASTGPEGYGAIESELFRQCPCAVLVVGPGHPSSHPQILAAVDASTEDPTEQALNLKVVETALLMARLESGSPTVLQAWVPVAENVVRTHVSDALFAANLEDMNRRAAEDLRRLARSFGDQLAHGQLVLRRGEPEEVIPEFVIAHGIDLVVIGTVARGGITGLLIGNTAERVLPRLPCSVLAVKPDGFESPVRVGAPD